MNPAPLNPKIEALAKPVAQALNRAGGRDPDFDNYCEARAILYTVAPHIERMLAEARKDEAEQCARRLEPIYDVLHYIYDRCEDEGDRIYLGSTNDHHTLKRQLRQLEKLFLLGPTALRARHAGESPDGR
jgi:hypothetical protein